MADKNKIVAGIDLGTTFSCIAAYVNNKVEVLADYDGNKTVPSIVAFTGKDDIQVGKLAKKNFRVEAGNRVYGEYLVASQLPLVHNSKIIDAKRILGRKLEDPEIQSEIPRWPFKLLEVNDTIKISVQDKLYDPEDISALVLKNLKENAEQTLEKPISDAVITVPAYFNNAQRNATMKAAARAGINLLRLISEPSAAALAYGLDKYYREKRTILIFDLGGGTLDVSILEIGEGHFRTLSTSGDTHLGGQDFDNRLFDHLMRKFKHDHEIDLMVYQNEGEKKKKEKAQRKLRDECQQAKHTLSRADHVEVAIEDFYGDIDLIYDLTRQQFENLNVDLFKLVMKCVQEALDGARLLPDNVDEIVLVGGSTRIPKIQEMIRGLFKKSQIVKTINVDECVAVGAALEAAKIAKIIPENFSVTEVTPFSLGIESKFERVFSKVVDRFTTIPFSKSQKFSTNCDNQTQVKFPVYEGENEFVKDNHFLGIFKIYDVTPMPAGEAKFKVTFKIDLNGILKVSAIDLQTGNQASVEIEYGKGRLAGVETQNETI
jgi:molecular chaperone DnaK (HSP70)